MRCGRIYTNFETVPRIVIPKTKIFFMLAKDIVIQF